MALFAPVTVEDAYFPGEQLERVAPSFTDDALERLDIDGGRDAIATDPELRHLATKRALMLYDKHLVRFSAHNTERNQQDLQYAEDMFRVCVTAAVQFADDAEASFIDDIVDLSMAYTALKPTLDYITPKTVDILKDDELAAAYLERMLGDGDLIHDWVPVIDWGHLQHVGGIEGIDVNGPHNADIITMQKWATRFADKPVGQVLGVELEAIDEMLKYPVLFSLPGVTIE